MSAAALKPRAARAAARAEATAERLAQVVLPSGGAAWLARAREAALARVAAAGIPDRREEYWRYTDPAALTAPEAAPAALFAITDEPEMFGAFDRLRLVFVDGVFDPAQSDDPSEAGLEITALAEAGGADIHWAADLYGTLEAAGQDPVARPLAALNTATATQGVCLRATAPVARPVALIYQRRDAGADAVVHHLVRVEPGASMTLLESGPMAARSSVVMEVCVGADATLHHVRTQGRDHQRRGLTHLFARLDAGARLRSFTLSANGALVRNEQVVWLNGKGASAHLAGAAVGDGAFHHDDTVFVTHAAPDCESRQVFKKVLRHGAVGVFQGKILVNQIAQRTDGYQLSQGLLLDEDCQFLAKPELEIYADDVKCSHGSTAGELSLEQLYYLRARGIPEGEAKGLLVLAFLAEALDEIADADLAEDVRTRLDGWLRRHRA
jgi:Fe-S cluster assembly protein SufD